MTAEERKQKFVMMYNELCENTGFQIEGKILPRMLGSVLQGEVRLDVVPIAGWQPPPEPKGKKDKGG